MRNILNKMAIPVVALTLVSCDLDEYNPASLSGDEVLQTYDGIKGLESYCYSALYQEMFRAYDFLSVAEGGTDLWQVPGGSDYAMQPMYYDGLTTNTNATNKLFKQAYSMIGNCNSVINKASAVTDGTKSNLDILVAEAKCLRGYYYSVLVAYYGPITLNLEEASENPTTTPKRNTVEEIYAQIIKDLTEASEVLGDTPFENNRDRVTKKTALGLLARVYAQGAGEYGLEENGVSYWQRAKEVSENMIATYGASCMYSDIEDMWAQANFKNNKEALFQVSGPSTSSTEVYNVNYCSNILGSVFPKPNNLDIYPTADNTNYLYGRTNTNVFAPSKYLIDLFDADNDKRWEQTFTYAYGLFSGVQMGGSYLYHPKNKPNSGEAKYGSNHGIATAASSCCPLNDYIISKYNLNPELKGKFIHPYCDLKTTVTDGTGTTQVAAKVWPKGETTGNVSHLQDVKNIFAVPYPVEIDDDRFAIVLAKKARTAEEKKQSVYYTINIEDLFTNGEYRTDLINVSNDNKIFPGLNKFNWMFDGSGTTNLQRRSGVVFVMRMAEMYLIAAEAEQKLGNPEKAAEYLNVLVKRAARNTSSYDAMKYSTASEQDVLDEYARELCGEYQRWVVLKRHKSLFKAQLQKGNPRAYRNFDESKHYLRPISYDFLSEIDNADEYGTNGY